MSFKTVPLKELLGDKGYLRGPFGSALKRGELKDNGIPVYEQQHAICGTRDFRFYIDNNKYKELKRFTTKASDLIISCSGTVGRVSIINETDPKGIISQALLILRPDTRKVLPQYLYYFLTSKRGYAEIINASQGAVQLNIAPRAVVEKIPVPLPGLVEQENIVKILSSLDDKIELNRQINQTLEQIAQTIFKSWFVDFEPVKAKIEAKQALTPALSQGEREKFVERAAMCAISGKLEPELDQLPSEQRQQLAATAALFPDELVESELGLIPLGWEVGTLADMVQLTGGGTPKRLNPEFWGGEIPWFSVQDAPTEGDVFVLETKEQISQFGLEGSSTRLLPVGTTIISARGTVGRLALTGVEMAMNQSCYGVMGADGIGPYFNYFNLENAVSTLKQNTHGAVFDTITRQTFETVSCIKPAMPVLKGFEAILTSLMESMRSNLSERRTLATLRDTLLLKLLSGELRPPSIPPTLQGGSNPP